MDQSGTDDFHGFRLHLGLERTPQQALQALQNFVRFLSARCRSTDPGAEIRTDLCREGLAGPVEIMIGQEAAEVGR